MIKQPYFHIFKCFNCNYTKDYFYINNTPKYCLHCSSRNIELQIIKNK